MAVIIGLGVSLVILLCACMAGLRFGDPAFPLVLVIMFYGFWYGYFVYLIMGG